MRPYKYTVITYGVLAIAAGFWGPFNSILIKQLINLLPSVAGEDISILIIPASLIIVNFIVFDNITWRGITYIRAKCVPEIINQVIGTSINYVLGQSHKFYQENLSGKISKQITNLADGIEKLIGTIGCNFLTGASLLCTAITTAYFVNPIFCFILVIWFVIFASLSILMSKKLVILSDSQAAAESIVVGELVDSLSNHHNVKIFSRTSFELLRMTPFFEKQRLAYRETYFYALVMHTIQGGLIAIMVACSCYFLIHLYRKNLVTIGDFALILGLSMETGHTMWFTMAEVDDFNKAVGRCKQSLMSWMTPLEILDTLDAVLLRCTEGKIVFKNVQFYYKEGHPLFENVSLEMKAGEKVGLVGYSGSGKSTFVNLILRLYDLKEGSILIDGHDIRTVTQDSLRENIAIIPQDPVLFHRSLMDNIRYGRIEATDTEVIEAARKAHAHIFITQLSQGYNTEVGERGAKLSGGQRQRIAIARAILKNSPILILDEATSQLDSVTESSIQESLWQLMQNKTTIVIAHRLSTLLNMDRILVFDKGKIVEDGTHSQLLTNNGLYKTLWNAQVGGFLSDKETGFKV
ncbi:putative ABC transporter ATP-binding protein [Holospora curviuscula]|uniref:Putative ABC transporter ATP-binding protein n=1 Tax=Holospora curviuscula TaxID=1082868 RepID=A0A2S5R714_9PROT|nr:ABC transporter ATP-binding protein [Holospora curviuscula]PPE02982.1 putative ABC transporter ATP-binding protein [Holospora curviuscula]